MKWLTVLVLPGLLFTGAAPLAGTLGQTHALDTGFRLSEAASHSRRVQSAGTPALLLAVPAVLLAAAGAGTLVAAWRRGRAGAGELAGPAESTVDLHGHSGERRSAYARRTRRCPGSWGAADHLRTQERLMSRRTTCTVST